MNTIVYGYAQISTMKQKIERQIDNIKRMYPDAVMITESFTGTTTDRPEWNKLYKKVVEKADKGETVTVVFDEVSRMSRNAVEGFALYQDLFNRGISLVFIKEPHINTSVFKDTLDKQIALTGNKVVDCVLEGVNNALMELARQQIEIAFQTAQHEVDYLHQRTSEGVRKAKERYLQEEITGVEHAKKLPGRQTGAIIETKKAKEMKQTILKHSKDFNGSLNDIDCMKITGLSRNTFYKYKRAIKTDAYSY